MNCGKLIAENITAFIFTNTTLATMSPKRASAVLGAATAKAFSERSQMLVKPCGHFQWKAICKARDSISGKEKLLPLRNLPDGVSQKRDDKATNSRGCFKASECVGYLRQ